MVPAPGKYEIKDMRKITVPQFDRSKNGSGKTVPMPGPGHYKVSHALVDERTPMWAQDKQAVKTFVDTIKQDKSKLPAPGHCGIPDSKHADMHGSRNHAKMLLHSRDVSHVLE